MVVVMVEIRLSVMITHVLGSNPLIPSMTNNEAKNKVRHIIIDLEEIEDASINSNKPRNIVRATEFLREWLDFTDSDLN